MRYYILFFALFVCIDIAEAEPQKLAILLFQNNGVDETSVTSIESLLRIELSSYEQYELISDPRIFETLQDTLCNDLDCAVRFGQQLGADHVITGSVLKLGDKIIFQYMLVDPVARTVLLNDRVSVERVEDFDTVLKRTAKSIVDRKPLAETAEVGLITETEARAPERRAANTLFGLSFGYLYGQKGYENMDRSFAMDVRLGQEFSNFEVGMLVGAHKGFAMNIFASYLFSKKDICPYLGAALGFHWVSHQDNSEYFYDYSRQEWIYKEKRADGLEFTLHSGIKLLRTYGLQVMANFAFCYTFNDYYDQATLFTIGLLF